MTSSQNRTIHMLLTQTGLATQKANIVFGATGGRSDSSRDLSDAEVRDLISYLRSLPNREADKADKMRKKILSMAHEMGWHILTHGKYHIDMIRVNAWMQKFSYLHKPLDFYKYNELPRLVTQFEAVYKTFLNKV